MNSSDSPPSIAELSDRLCLGSSSVEIHGRTFELLHPRSVDDLIGDAENALDDRLPYWGAIWPSARMLAGKIAGQAGQGRRLLELGCGVGLVALAAAQAGFEVLATDYYAEACACTLANAQRNGFEQLRVRSIDWRDLPSDLGLFDFILASDVLYERGYTALIAAVLDRLLAPSGIGWLTDPGRNIARSFRDECRKVGLASDCIELEQIVDGGLNNVVELYEIRRQPGRLESA